MATRRGGVITWHIMRVILHVDMDAFFAAIEQRDHPEWRGKPLIVGGPIKRGVVSTASYEARPFGVHSALPMALAIKRCPQAIVVPGRMAVYAEVSQQLMAILESFSPHVEPLSLDEAFVDMTGCEKLYGPPDCIARAIQERIQKETRLTCSIGLAGNKFLAKLASDLDKPNGVTWVPFGREAGFIAPLPVGKLWGVGPKSVARLEELGLRTIGDVAAADLKWLRSALGSLGDHIHTLACAEDDRPVVSGHERQSIGSEVTLEADVRGRAQVEPVLRAQCQRVARHLRRKRCKARAVRVKVRYSQTFQLATRDAALPMACDDSASLFDVARTLLNRLDLDSPLRLVGAAAFDLVVPGQATQADLFQQPKADKHSRLEHTLDAIQDRFGDKVHRGSGEPDAADGDS
jgi:DNA polymerase-4